MSNPNTKPKTSNHWWWPFDAHLYIEDMSGYSLEERGALVTAFNAYYLRRKKDNNVPDNRRLPNILQLTPAEFKKHKKVLLENFSIVDGEWHLPWMDEAILHAAEVSKAKSSNGRKGAAARWKNNQPVVNDDFVSEEFLSEVVQ